ncbi:MAG: hypothetical protein CL566_07445 [Alphaproteobacteria bacterium]|nr:hypothetical protein [Alphaproteobacteria bacterium]
MFGPREVLTAAHCQWNKRTLNWLVPDSVNFLAGYRRGEFMAHDKVVDYTLGDPLVTLNDGGRFRPHDWATLHLAEPIDDVTVTVTLGLSSTPVQEYIQAGYSKDEPHILTIDEGCPVDDTRNTGGLLFHGCDAVGGDSGSPILGISGDALVVHGVHVATCVGGGGDSLEIAIPIDSVADGLN